MGGLMLLAVGLVHGRCAHWAPNPSGLMALFYLTFFSSCLAYTAYGWLSLMALPPWSGLRLRESGDCLLPRLQFLHEHLSGTQLIGMVVIIVGGAFDAAGRQPH